MDKNVIFRILSVVKTRNKFFWTWGLLKMIKNSLNCLNLQYKKIWKISKLKKWTKTSNLTTYPGFSGKNPVFRKIPDKWSNLRFLSIFSTLKFFKFFYIVNLVNLNCFQLFAKNRRSIKIYFAFWRPSICEKWHFFDFKIFQNFLYCKSRQFKLFFIIC